MRDNDRLLAETSRILEQGDEEDRYRAISDLCASDDAAVIPALMDAIRDPRSYRIRDEALRKVCSFPVGIVLPVVEEFLRDDDHDNLRNAAIDVFQRLGTAAIRHLMGILEDPNEEVRLFATQILGQIADPLCVDALIARLGDRDDNVRHAAAESLGKIGDARAVAPLIDALQGGFWTRFPVLVALGEIGDIAAVPHLVPLLTDDMLRQTVLEALGKIGDISVMPLLEGLLEQGEPSIRNDVIAALVSIQTRAERAAMPDGFTMPSLRESLGRSELVGHLIESLGSADPLIRKNAVIALGWLRERRAASKLIELLGDYDIEEFVIGSLVAMGEEALPDLLASLESADPRVRVALIRCIGWIDQPEAIAACAPFLRDRDDEVRYQAIITLARVIDLPMVEDAFVELLDSTDDVVMGAVVEVLGRSSSPGLRRRLMAQLRSTDIRSKVTCIQILGRMKAADATGEIQALTGHSSDEVRNEALCALAAIDPAAVPSEILHRGALDPSPMVRKTVAVALARGAGQDLPILEALIRDEDPEVKLAALEGLGARGGEAVAEKLVQVFGSGGRRHDMSIIRILGGTGGRTAVRFLSNLIRQGDADVKHAALEALGKIGDPSSAPQILLALDDASWNVRGEAVTALGKIGDRRFVPHILGLLTDREEIVRKMAINALVGMGVREASAAILPLAMNEGLQREVIDALEHLGIADLEQFEQVFKRSSSRFKVQLVSAVGRMRNPDHLPFLRRILKEEFFTVRRQAAKALGECGGDREIPALLEAQRDDPSEEVRREAQIALQRLGKGR
jgi:HEAT repeat protein